MLAKVKHRFVSQKNEAGHGPRQASLPEQATLPFLKSSPFVAAMNVSPFIVHKWISAILQLFVEDATMPPSATQSPAAQSRCLCRSPRISYVPGDFDTGSWRMSAEYVCEGCGVVCGRDQIGDTRGAERPMGDDYERMTRQRVQETCLHESCPGCSAEDVVTILVRLKQAQSCSINKASIVAAIVFLQQYDLLVDRRELPSPLRPAFVCKCGEAFFRRIDLRFHCRRCQKK